MARRWMVLCVLVMVHGAARAEEPPPQQMGARFQGTYVWQDKRAFDAAYSGPNSLSPDPEESYSFTATASLGIRPWTGGEIYFDPEIAQGAPLSGLTGLAGFTNGEIARTTGPELTFYAARLFVRQTWGLGGDRETLQPDMDQLAGAVDRRRLVLTAGKLSIMDLFDDNAYSHDPRTQFLNWSLMTHGAFDYAADARGYSVGIALEYDYDDWAVRGGRFMMPRESNGLSLNPNLLDSYGDQVECGHAHRIGSRSGRLRVLAYRNRADMGGYRDALAAAAAAGTTPDITTAREPRAKHGFGVNLEQELTRAIGFFTRASWNNGEAEEFAFTEIDRSLSAGLSLRGTGWHRAQDTLGLALVANGISAPHRDYLAAGGLGFFLGDGALRYHEEDIAEAYYSVGIVGHAWISADFQHISNPAYNADRGPVSVFSLRAHCEF